MSNGQITVKDGRSRRPLAANLEINREIECRWWFCRVGLRLTGGLTRQLSKETGKEHAQGSLKARGKKGMTVRVDPVFPFEPPLLRVPVCFFTDKNKKSTSSSD
ncbi:hypothetical protein E3N88_45738 [Mikania micrantha]|uniref:Uncharacterized protein n=1 Tax=Mikania micrantha TaxID=192012 RepID=A0A5N6L8A6_9ASTR|nr:hypothetical protein E3N88_45738 [Mikania micrantha]